MLTMYYIKQQLAASVYFQNKDETNNAFALNNTGSLFVHRNAMRYSTCLDEVHHPYSIV